MTVIRGRGPRTMVEGVNIISPQSGVSSQPKKQPVGEGTPTVVKTCHITSRGVQFKESMGKCQPRGNVRKKGQIKMKSIRGEEEEGTSSGIFAFSVLSLHSASGF